MFKRFAGGFKRAAALMMSVFIILSQMALPAAALAQEVDWLPTLNLSYSAGDGTQTVEVLAQMYAQQPVYWATLPADALQSGVTLEIVPLNGDETYNSTMGYQLFAPNASEVSEQLIATYIEVYRGGGLSGSYPLYLSTLPLPEEKPTYFDPQPVQINYYDENGNIIGGYSDSVPMEGKTFWAEQLDGYELTSNESVTVTMDGSGQLSQNTVSFYYAKVVRYASITVKVVDSADAGNVLFSFSDQYAEGSHPFDPAGYPLPEYYQLDSFDVQYVNVYGDGTADRSEVVFTATYYPPAPKYAYITVKVVDSADAGNVLYTFGGDYGEGSQAFDPAGYPLPENYQLDSYDVQYVNVYADGTADRSEVVFTATYYPPAPKYAYITVKVVDSADAGNVLYTFGGDYGEGSQAFDPAGYPLPENYQLDSYDVQYVNVYADGTADRSEVVFTATYYPPAPKYAYITVKVVDSADANNVLYTFGGDYGEGSQAFDPTGYPLPENYQLDNYDVQYVNVYADGTADRSEVVFTATYYPPAPKTAFITVLVVDSVDNSNVLYSHGADYAEGSHAFDPSVYALPENYQLDSYDTQYVNVYADGTADRNEVVFTATYYAPQQPDEPDQPVEPQYAAIVVKVVDSADASNVLYSFGGDYGEGSHAFDPSIYPLPENYQLDSFDVRYVNVYVDGTADAYEVVFTATYHAPQQPDEPDQPAEPVLVTVQVLVVDSANTASVLYSDSYQYTEGAYTFNPTYYPLPENYQLDSTEIKTVNVYADGTADAYEVVFTATYHAPQQPDEPDQGDPSLPEGCTLVSEINAAGKTTANDLALRTGPGKKYGSNVVRVNKNTELWVNSLLRNADGEEWYCITFKNETRYVMASYVELTVVEPVVAQVTFLYQDEGGETLMDAWQENLSEGSYQTAAYAKAAPEGYEYVGVNAETVIIDANGANPATVIFTYKPVQQPVLPVEATVTFRYVCDGAEIGQAVTQKFGAGSYAAADYKQEFSGYTYAGVSADTIIIGEDGSASAAEVVFTYNRNPVTGSVTIHHRLTDDTAVPGLSSETKSLPEGSHSVQQFVQNAEGYTYLSATAETVTVDANGANPAEVVLYYQKNVVEATVTISILDANGNTIPGVEGYTVKLGEGTYATGDITPDVPEGYAYEGASHSQITVTSAGADPSVVVFYFSKLPVEAQVTFRYVDEQGNEVPGLAPYTVTLAEGTHDAAEYAIRAPHGYLYNGSNVEQIVINANGASPAEVWFTYTRLPEGISIPVYHQDADGKPLMEATSLSFDASRFGTTINVRDVLSIAAPEGYIYGGINTDSITIDQRGGVSPEAIYITYVVRPRAEADVTFRYVCDGQPIAEPNVVRLSEGEWDSSEYAVVKEGYKLVSISAPMVSILEDGTASPAEVIFTYEKLVTTAFLRVHYRNSFGEELPGSPEIRELGKGTHTITPNAAYAPANHVLSANTQVYQVTVNDDLTLSVPSVSFNYYDAALTGTVIVKYYDTESGTIFATEERKLAPGTHVLEPNEELVSSKGNYERGNFYTNGVVTVDEKGVATPTEIMFDYKPAAYTGYQGYLLVIQPTVMRQQPGNDGAVVLNLPKDTVLATTSQYQSGAVEWYGGQTMTGDAGMGWVDGTHVTRISTEEAMIRIEEANQPDELEQNPGYYMTIMNNVPLRQYKNTASQAKYLNINTVVWVDGQEYDDTGDAVWHIATYHDYANMVRTAGYIRDGQLRKMTQEEVDQYLASNEPIVPDDSDNNEFDPNSPSSYGYVTRDSVNFRSEPGGTRLKMLNKYGMALIMGTREVNGVTWYNVNYDGQVGWIHGDYFHQMTLSEFTSFMGSDAYYQGIINNTPNTSGDPGNSGNSGNSGSPTQGDVSSVEDWNVGVWQNPAVNPQTSYQPFNPYATPVPTTSPRGKYILDSANVKLYALANENSTFVTLPQGAEISIAGTVQANGKTWYQVTYEGRNGYVDVTAVVDQLSPTPTPEPTSTFVIGTMIPIDYDDPSTETQSGNVPWGLIGGGIVLLGGLGGAYAFALNQNKKRKAAARAAASKRAAAANATAAGNASPYARRAVAAAPNGQQRPTQPTASRPQQPQANPYGRPAAPQQPQANPYSRPSAPQQSAANPYARPQTPSAPIANPYAAPTAPASQTANPYARPITPPSQTAPGADAQSSGSTAAPRRSRMQRYHDAGSSDGGNA